MATFVDAQPYVTGACHFVIRTREQGPKTSGGGGSGPAMYLGTSEFSPYIEIDKQYVPLYNDLGGPAVPFDLCYAGKQAFVACDLTRFNIDALTAIQSDPTFDEDELGDALIDGRLDIGSLLDTEGLGIELYLIFPYAGSVSAYEKLYQGYHFLLACPPKVIWNRLGTQPVKIHVSWHCIRTFDPQGKKFLLADTNIDPALGVIL